MKWLERHRKVEERNSREQRGQETPVIKVGDRGQNDRTWRQEWSWIKRGKKRKKIRIT